MHAGGRLVLASLRKRQCSPPSDRELARADVVPTRQMQRVWPSGASVGRPGRPSVAPDRTRSLLTRLAKRPPRRDWRAVLLVRRHRVRGRLRPVSRRRFQLAGARLPPSRPILTRQQQQVVASPVVGDDNRAIWKQLLERVARFLRLVDDVVRGRAPQPASIRVVKDRVQVPQMPAASISPPFSCRSRSRMPSGSRRPSTFSAAAIRLSSTGNGIPGTVARTSLERISAVRNAAIGDSTPLRSRRNDADP
jgi:hypothetical protein